MSEPLSGQAIIDWKLVASAIGVFIATLVTTVWGWIQGRKKVEKGQTELPHLPDLNHLRDNTQSMRDLRDQLLLLSNVLERHIRSHGEFLNELKDLVERLDKEG